MIDGLKELIKQFRSNSWKQNLFIFFIFIPNTILLMVETSALHVYDCVMWVYEKEGEFFKKLKN